MSLGKEAFLSDSIEPNASELDEKEALSLAKQQILEVRSEV